VWLYIVVLHVYFMSRVVYQRLFLFSIDIDLIWASDHHVYVFYITIYSCQLSRTLHSPYRSINMCFSELFKDCLSEANATRVFLSNDDFQSGVLTSCVSISLHRVRFSNREAYINQKYISMFTQTIPQIKYIEGMVDKSSSKFALKNH